LIFFSKFTFLPVIAVCPCYKHSLTTFTKQNIKGSPVHIAPTCAGSEEGTDHFGSYVYSLFLQFCKRLFPGLEPMISWSPNNNFTKLNITNQIQSPQMHVPKRFCMHNLQLRHRILDIVCYCEHHVKYDNIKSSSHTIDNNI
jgi:hypothetical protein